MPLAIVHGFVRNQGDGWSQTMTYLGQFLDECALLPAEEVEARPDHHEVFLGRTRQLALRTAELHRALATETDDVAFRAEPVSETDLANWSRRLAHEADTALATLGAHLGNLDAEARADGEFLLARRGEIMERIGAQMPARVEAYKTRIHGDYHLGQVLVAQQDFYIIDFEGEPRKTPEERREKQLPLRDIAGLLRSLDYAAWAALTRVTQDHPHRRDLLRNQALAWRDQVSAAFLDAYREAIRGCRSHPQDEAVVRSLLVAFMMEKAFYEIQYELANRPSWVAIPLSGAMSFLFPEFVRTPHAS
jgi:maltose alpha-D-glucosyltransferase / alpha-amylase